MQAQEFTNIREYLGKTQKQLGRLLCVSTKSIQSHEQGWREIPPNIERQLMFLLSLKRTKEKSAKPCWRIKKCPIDWRVNCAAWEFQAGHLCWFINGTFCQGKEHDCWDEKIEMCQKCEVFQSMLPNPVSDNA